MSYDYPSFPEAKVEAPRGADAAGSRSGSHGISARRQFKRAMGFRRPLGRLPSPSTGCRSTTGPVSAGAQVTCGRRGKLPDWALSIPISRIRRLRSRVERDLIKDLLARGVLLSHCPRFHDSWAARTLPCGSRCAPLGNKPWCSPISLRTGRDIFPARPIGHLKELPPCQWPTTPVPKFLRKPQSSVRLCRNSQPLEMRDSTQRAEDRGGARGGT